MLWFVTLSVGGEKAPIIPLLLVSGIAGSIVIWHAAHGKRWALITLYAVGILFISTSFRTRERGDIGLDWQVGLKFIFWLSYLAIGVLNVKRLAQFLGDPMTFCIVMYFLLAALSIVYSEAPLASTAYLTVVVAYFVFACVFVDYMSFRDVMLIVTWTLFIYTAINLLSVVLAPQIAYPQAVSVDVTGDDLDRLKGFTGHPNNLGGFTQVFMIFLIGSIYHGFLRRRLWIPMGLVGVLVIYLTHDRTAVLALIMASIMQLPRRILWPTITYMGFAAISILLSGETTAIFALVGRGGSASEAETMSGRTELWQFTAELIKARPWLGYGFDSFEAYAGTVWTGDDWAPVVSPHNDYLMLLYNGGILGAVPWVAAMVILLYRWFRHPYLPRDLMVFTILFKGFSEGDIPTITMIPTFSLFITLALEAKRWITQKSLR